MHIIAAKAACFLEAQQPEYRSYMQQFVNNAREPTIICYWLMCFPKASQASRQKRRLRSAGMTVNKNTIPYVNSPMKTSNRPYPIPENILV